VLLAAFLLGGPSANAHHMVVRCNLEEMTVRADRIFTGQCVNVQTTSRRIAGGILPVTDYTFKVETVIKGSLPLVFTFTQLGHPPHPLKPLLTQMLGGQSGTGFEVSSQMMHGAASYNVGDRLLLFLTPEHTDGRLSAPVGLYQGAFYRSTMPSGQELVRNQINNEALFAAPYTGSALTREQAKIIFPESASNPIAGALLSGLDIQTLEHKRGPLPLNAIVTLVHQINVAHGGQPGIIVAAKGALR